MELFKSKKFWMSVVGVGAVVISNYFGVDEASINRIAGLIITAIIGQAAADFGKNAKK